MNTNTIPLTHNEVKGLGFTPQGNKEYVLIIDNDDACDNKRITVVSDAVFINRTQYLLCTVNHLQLM